MGVMIVRESRRGSAEEEAVEGDNFLVRPAIMLTLWFPTAIRVEREFTNTFLCTEKATKGIIADIAQALVCKSSNLCITI